MRRIAVASSAALLMTACSGGEPTTERFCREVADLLETDLRNLDVSSSDDPATRSGLESTADQFEDVAAASPADIRPSVDILAGLTRAYATAIAETDIRDPFGRSAAIFAAQQEFADDLEPALERYQAYVTQHCVPSPGG